MLWNALARKFDNPEPSPETCRILTALSHDVQSALGDIHTDEH
jgi:hypothetical protein